MAATSGVRTARSFRNARHASTTHRRPSTHRSGPTHKAQPVPIRQALVERVRAEIAKGTYETPDKIEALLNNLAKDLL